MLVVVSGLVRLTSSFIQGRVYRDTDAPNMRPVMSDDDGCYLFIYGGAVMRLKELYEVSS